LLIAASSFPILIVNRFSYDSRVHANEDTIPSDDVTTLSDKAIEAAIKEFQDGVKWDDEGDEGELEGEDESEGEDRQ